MEDGRTRILIVGAHGQIARVATDLFLAREDVDLTLFLRRAGRLKSLASERVRVVEGDALDPAALEAAMAGQDVVYANLSGNLEGQARAIVDAMERCGLTRLIFVLSMGIHDEVPGQRPGSILDPYRKAGRIVEASGLEYTLVRPAWLDDRDEIRYGTTRKGEAFRNAGATVSRRSVADLVIRLAMSRGLHARESLGVHHA